MIKNSKKLKVMSIVGTRPEIIRLSRVFSAFSRPPPSVSSLNRSRFFLTQPVSVPAYLRPVPGFGLTAPLGLKPLAF